MKKRLRPPHHTFNASICHDEDKRPMVSVYPRFLNAKQARKLANWLWKFADWADEQATLRRERK